MVVFKCYSPATCPQPRQGGAPPSCMHSISASVSILRLGPPLFAGIGAGLRPAPCCARNAASAFMDLAFFADFCANALASAAGRSDTRVPLIMRVGKIIRGIRAAPARSTAAFRNALIPPRRRKWPREVGAGLSSRPGGPNLPIRGLDSRAETRSALVQKSGQQSG